MSIALVQPDPSSALTVEAAIRLVNGWTDLTQGRRRGLVAALSAVAAMAGQPPANMRLTPASLRQPVLNQPAATWGIKAASKSNIRSRLRKVMRRLDLIEPADTPLSAAWQILLHRLEPLHRSGITGLARFCTGEGITPAAVDGTTFTAFQTHLENRTLTPRPRKRVGDLRNSWNQACGTVAGWPVNKIPAIVTPNQYVLPAQAFPDSFRADLAAFARQLGSSLLDPVSLELNLLELNPAIADAAVLSRPPRPLRASTIALRLDHARWAASALVATGVPVETITSLACLVSPIERAHAILGFLYRRAGCQPSAAGMHVADVLRILAKYHLGLPDTQVSWLKRWSQEVTLVYKGMTEKNERAIAAVMQPGCERRLLELPDAYMAAARKRLATEPREAAGLALRALAIEILTTYPFRLANLLGLRFDRHLHRADPRGLVSGILISGPEVKNNERIVLPISPRLGRFIEEWSTRFRGLIATPGCGYLFPGFGTGDQSMTPQGMREAIKGAMADYVGAVLTPHQFRHLARRTLPRGLSGPPRGVAPAAGPQVDRNHHPRLLPQGEQGGAPMLRRGDHPPALDAGPHARLGGTGRLAARLTPGAWLR